MKEEFNSNVRLELERARQDVIADMIRTIHNLNHVRFRQFATELLTVSNDNVIKYQDLYSEWQDEMRADLEEAFEILADRLVDYVRSANDYDDLMNVADALLESFDDEPEFEKYVFLYNKYFGISQ